MKRLRSFSRRRRGNYYWFGAWAIHSIESRFRRRRRKKNTVCPMSILT